MAALLSGDIAALATSFSEAVPLAEAGKVRITGITAPERNAAFPAAPTLVEQGVEALFVNWRGFFAVPGLSADKADAYRAVIRVKCTTHRNGRPSAPAMAGLTFIILAQIS